MLKRVSTYLLFAFLFVIPSFILLRAQTNNTNNEDNIILDVQNAQKNVSGEAWIRRIGLEAPAVSTFNILAGELVANADGTYSLKNENSVIAKTNEFIANAYVQPISGTQYLAGLKNNLLGHQVYAQGTGQGFQGLQALLPVWKAFRNLVYLAASLLFIVLGLMIIFRVKINPQTVVNIQNAIPQIISTLLLVTFSYAIAGLVIDLMTFLQASFLALLFSSTGTPLGSPLFNNEVLGNLGQFNFTNFFSRGFANIYDLSFGLVAKGTLAVWSGITNTIISGIFVNHSSILNIAGNAAAGLAIGMGTLLITLVFAIIVIFFQIKFLIGLIKAYISIIFKIIIAPLEIGLGAIPGIKGGFSNWLNDLFANAMIFPISFLFLVIANLILSKAGNGIWAPSIIDATGIIGNFNLPMFFIGFGALMLVSQLPELIPQAIFSLKPSAWETAIGKGYANSVGKTVNTVWSTGKEQAITEVTLGRSRATGEIARILDKLAGSGAQTAKERREQLKRFGV